MERTIEAHEEMVEEIKKVDVALQTLLFKVSHTITNKSISLDDEATRTVILNRNGEPVALLACSNSKHPNTMKDLSEMVRRYRDELSSESREPIISPLASGDYNGLSYALWPWCRPLNEKMYQRVLFRSFVRSNVLAWLRQIMEETKRDILLDADNESLDGCLSYVESNEDFLPDCRRWAEEARSERASGSWSPQHCLSHGDLWAGNIMFPNVGYHSAVRRNQFRVIDWGGSNLKGFPYADLVYFCVMTKVSKKSFVRTMKGYARSLGEREDTLRFYVAAHLGYLGLNLNQFPYARLVELSNAIVGYASVGTEA